jgi:hypothetical protein
MLPGGEADNDVPLLTQPDPRRALNPNQFKFGQAYPE